MLVSFFWSLHILADMFVPSKNFFFDSDEEFAEEDTDDNDDFVEVREQEEVVDEIQQNENDQATQEALEVDEHVSQVSKAIQEVRDEVDKAEVDGEVYSSEQENSDVNEVYEDVHF